MLNHLHVRNLAVVDEIEVELDSGMTVLTGETGAGKSILVDALSLALGSRADSDAVRPGAQRAEISASLQLAPDSLAQKWLIDNDLDADNECLLRRVVTPEGRSRGYINGNTVSMQMLREIGALTVDICGQQAHQYLALPDNQRSLLDRHGGHTNLLTELQDVYNAWHAAQAQFDSLAAARADQDARLELLSFQVDELRTLAPQPGELADLEQEHSRAANAARLLAGTGEALAALYENDDASAHDLIGRAQGLLDELSEFDSNLEPVAALLTDASIQVSEAADTLRTYLNHENVDPQRLQELDTRLAAFHELARKHRVTPSELPELVTKLEQDLNQIETADETLDKLHDEATAHQKRLTSLGKKLTTARKKAVRSLDKLVTANMQQLGMPEGQFTVNLTPLDSPGPSGAERVEFMVAMNPGIPPGPLNKIASGGELSRVSLAIQVASSEQSDVPTLIFDEVDAGVGGGTAEIVGEKLQRLAHDNQVLCVTHLPQVASKGSAHLRVNKLSDGDNTRTRVTHLNGKERIEEIARMLGGVKITAKTREHAAEMLGHSRATRSTA